MRGIITTFCILTLLAFNLVSCTDRHKVRKQMVEFMNNEIILPDGLECICDREITTFDKGTLKSTLFVMYCDSMECSSCRIAHMMDMYPLYDMADTSEFSVLTIFSPRADEVDDVRLQLMTAGHQIPILVDTEGMFRSMNRHIPSDNRFHSFLLDGSNKPVFVGNPLASSQLLELFRNCLEK